MQALGGMSQKIPRKGQVLPQAPDSHSARGCLGKVWHGSCNSREGIEGCGYDDGLLSWKAHLEKRSGLRKQKWIELKQYERGC